MKSNIKATLFAAFAGVLVTLAKADPITVQPVMVPPQPVRIAPLVLPAADAVTAIAQIKADNCTVLLSGTTVTVMPPYGMLITSGTNAGKIAVVLYPKPVTTGTVR